MVHQAFQDPIMHITFAVFVANQILLHSYYSQNQQYEAFIKSLYFYHFQKSMYFIF